VGVPHEANLGIQVVGNDEDNVRPGFIFGVLRGERGEECQGEECEGGFDGCLFTFLESSVHECSA
jgi:hypothetical protein